MSIFMRTVEGALRFAVYRGDLLEAAFHREEDANLYRLRLEWEETVPFRDTTVDAMTPAVWRRMDPDGRRRWTQYWNSRLRTFFRCTRCGFPASSGCVGCIACEPP